MSIRKIKKIAVSSYDGSKLNAKIVNYVADKLSRRELRIYVQALKNIQMRKTVKVYIPTREIMTQDMKNSLGNFFKNKDLDVIVDPALMVGIRVVDNDMIYELNLKDSLENMIEYIQKSYD